MAHTASGGVRVAQTVAFALLNMVETIAKHLPATSHVRHTHRIAS